MPTTLAATDLFRQILPWLGALVVVAVIGGFIMSAARRMLTSDASDASAEGFTLHDLRRLKERGEITPEEYERAKANFMHQANPAAGHSAPPADGADRKTGAKPPDR